MHNEGIVSAQAWLRIINCYRLTYIKSHIRQPGVNNYPQSYFDYLQTYTRPSFSSSPQWRIYPLAKSAMAPFGPNFFFDIVKKMENLVSPPPPPICVSTSGQQTFGPPLYAILNTPLVLSLPYSGFRNSTEMKYEGYSPVISKIKYFGNHCLRKSPYFIEAYTKVV